MSTDFDNDAKEFSINYVRTICKQKIAMPPTTHKEIQNVLQI